MGAYSFLDVSAAITGPGGSFQLTGQGNAEEGISVEALEDKNIMTVGADGQAMHSLVASAAATVTVRVLKTSPLNAQLQNLYNYQTASSSRHGQNTITIRDAARGDNVTIEQCAFARQPTIGYATDGGLLEWVFHGAICKPIIGTGTPEVA